MREELIGPKVENVAVAIVQEEGEDKQFIYNTYLINLRPDEIMEGIIITSKGYGENVNTGEKIKTSMLRHCLEILLPNEAARIEPIMEEVFGLTNEYWVSFYQDKKMFDKKFIFLPETIKKENCITIPIINKKGVLIK